MVLEKKILNVLPYMGLAAMLINEPWPVEQFLIPL